MYSVAPCDLPVSWSPSGWEPQSHCDFGRLRCHGSTCKEHYRCVISHTTITPCGKKNNDMVRLVRASECEVDGDDNTMFTRFWRGFGGFWGGKTLPKPSPNPSKIKILKNMQFGIVFCLVFLMFSIFDFLKICVSPRRERGF